MAASKVVLLLYSVIGALTLMFQVGIRLQQCEWFGGCALSLVKAVVWSVIWPIYWPAYLGWF